MAPSLGRTMRAALLLPLLALAGCNADETPTGVSADEAAQLNEAAATLDINASDPDAPETKE